MMFLAVSQNVGDPTPYLAAEDARMQELQQTGVVEQMLLKADWSGAVLLLRAADQAAAREAVGSLPLVTQRDHPVPGVPLNAGTRHAAAGIEPVPAATIIAAGTSRRTGRRWRPRALPAERPGHSGGSQESCCGECRLGGAVRLPDEVVGSSQADRRVQRGGQQHDRDNQDVHRQRPAVDVLEGPGFGQGDQEGARGDEDPPGRLVAEPNELFQLRIDVRTFMTLRR